VAIPGLTFVVVIDDDRSIGLGADMALDASGGPNSIGAVFGGSMTLCTVFGNIFPAVGLGTNESLIPAYSAAAFWKTNAYLHGAITA